MSYVLSVRFSDELVQAVEDYARVRGWRRGDVVWQALMAFDDRFRQLGSDRHDRRYDKGKLRAKHDRPILRYDDDPLLRKLMQVHPTTHQRTIKEKE